MLNLKDFFLSLGSTELGINNFNKKIYTYFSTTQMKKFKIISAAAQFPSFYKNICNNISVNDTKLRCHPMLFWNIILVSIRSIIR